MGHGVFDKYKNLPAHEVLIDPLLFSSQLIRVRNQLQKADMAKALLSKVLVYRGQPSSEHDPKPYARNQAQQARWQRDPRVIVEMRPLKYTYVYDGNGKKVCDANGRLIVKGKQEKGIDVLCALALVREARSPGVDLVILASQDTDLEPALDEALSQYRAKVETFCWFNSKSPGMSRQLRPINGRTIWNTRLREEHFQRCWDLTDYQ